MKKSLMSLLAIIPFFSATIAMIGVQTTELKYQNIYYNHKNLYITNANQSLDDNYLNIKGQHYNTTYRIFMNSNGNKVLPKESNTDYNDYLIGKGNKDEWYNHLIYGLSLDVTNYEANKTDFLKKYKAITTIYLYMYNFWNGMNGWTDNLGKDIPFSPGVYTFNLGTDNKNVEMFNKSDDSHSNNEKTKLVIEQAWDGNILNINWRLSISYHWAGGSIYNHAALGGFKNDTYTFLSIPTDEMNPNPQVKLDNIAKTSSFTLASSSEVSGLSAVDSDLKAKAKGTEIKNAILKFSPLFVQGYVGVKTVTIPNRIIIYTLSIIIVWFPQSNPALDSTALLNDIPFERTMTSIYNGTRHQFLYQSTSSESYTNPKWLPSEYIGIKLFGAMTVPFVYIV